MKKALLLFIVILFIFLGIYYHTRENREEIPGIDVNMGNDFSLNFVKLVNSNRLDNYLVSPYSVEMALNLLKTGADGLTKEEIDKVIGDREISNVIVKDRIGVANAAFIRDMYKEYIKKEYTNTLKNNYNAEILYDEFKSPKVINDWVSDKTYKMIDKILNKMDDDFVLGLANALAIDVEWENEFECISTVSGEFTKENGKKVNVEMMHNSAKSDVYKYFSLDDAEGIVMQYKKYDKEGNVSEDGKSLEFLAILPNGDLREYINNLTFDKINQIDNSLISGSSDLEIQVAIPRFKYSYDLDDFMDVLENLGVKLAFTKDADFTNIISKEDMTKLDMQGLYVSDAIHKTHIDFNEKGTKAAAVTYFGLFKATGVMDRPKIKIITFDKPFMYIIRDTETKEMLFFGTVYEPNVWKGRTCKEK